jgi:hypothetical protein
MPKREQQQAELARAQADLSRTQARKSQQSALLGNVLGAGATLLASDKMAKKDVKKDSSKHKDFLDKISAYSYEYKDPEMPGAAKGKRHGVLAQELEKSEIGKSMVKDTEYGKMVDYGQGFGAILASQAELNKRLSALEKKKGKA